MEKEVCRGECLFGKCPYKVCVKYAAYNKKAAVSTENMQIMTDGVLPTHQTDRRGAGIAVDIGTTTVAVYLYDMGESRVLAVESAINAQTSFGLDVISRIKFCVDDEDGLELMHSAIADQLNLMIGAVCKKAEITKEEIVYGVITGNTTMMHLLCKLSPVTMGVLPFEPLSYFGNSVRMEELGINLPNAECYLPPCISAFVGADITTDMLTAGYGETDRYSLLMDIGTNGEIALGNRHRVVSSSTAAGPAFEGAHISCGMAGVSGAINGVYTLEGKLCYTTIENVPPRGLCGSGLLDAIAVFLQAGIIDETGRIDDGATCFVEEIDGESAVKITDKIYITQKDIREFQTAKAAVAAGVLALMHEAGIAEGDIDTVYIAGGFGNYMNIESARAVGLIPKEINTKSIGNAAATGAALILLDDGFKRQAHAVKTVAEHVELGGNPYFMEKYIDCMYFV